MFKCLKNLRKIITVLIVSILILTVSTTVVGSRGFFNDNLDLDREKIEKPLQKILELSTKIKERLTLIKDRILSLLDRLSQFKDKLSNIIDQTPINNVDLTDNSNNNPSRVPLVKTLRTFLLLRNSNSSFMFYTNYNGEEKHTKLKFFGDTLVDVDGNGEDDISARLKLYPFIERPLRLSFNFKLSIERLDAFPDINANFSAYTELYFPGLLIPSQNGNRIRFGYESPQDEEVPKNCAVTYKFMPNLLNPFKRPEHKAKLDPGEEIVGKSKLVMLLSYTNFYGEDIASEIRSRIFYNPAVVSEISIGGDGLLGGLSFEFSRTNLDPSDVDIYCAFEKNETVIYGYATDMPQKVTFTMELGREGFIEFDTHGSPPTQIGVCNNFYDLENANKIYFTNLPSKAKLEWHRHLLFQKKYNISFYTDVEGLSLIGDIKLPDNGSVDFEVKSNENLDCNFDLDFEEGHLIIQRCETNISFSLSADGTNNGTFDLSFGIDRFYDSPFIITFGKLINEKIEISFAAKSFVIYDFYLLINRNSSIIGLKFDKLIKTDSGNIIVLLSYEKDQDGNVTFSITIYIINGLKIRGLSVAFNGQWSQPIDRDFNGSGKITFTVFLEGVDFEYYIADDWSWGYFFFRGSITYETYRYFEHNGILGGIKGKIYAASGSDGINISWYTVNESGMNLTKLNITGAVFGIEDFHFYYGDILNFSITEIAGSIEVIEACRRSGYVMLELIGDQKNLDIDFSIDLKNETNASSIGLNFTLDDFHMDISDKTIYLEALWDDGNFSTFKFNADANINLSIADMDVYLYTYDNVTISNGDLVKNITYLLENLSGYIKGYAGIKVNLTFPLDLSIANLSLFANLTNQTFAISLIDTEIYLNADFIPVFEQLGVHLIATGTVTISLLNMSLYLDPDPLWEGQMFWVNLLVNIDATNGILDAKRFYIKNIPTVGLMEIENLTVVGNSNIQLAFGLLAFVFLTYIVINVYNGPDTSVTFQNFSLGFPLPFGMPLPLRLFEGDFVEGTFEVLIRALGLIEIELKNGSNVNYLGVEVKPGGILGYADSATINIVLNQPLDYLHLDVNQGMPDINKSFMLIDTKNTTATFNLYVYFYKDFLNDINAAINQYLNWTSDPVENDWGLRFNDTTLQADYFYIDLFNFSITGYLHLESGEILTLVNGSWEPLLPGGEGFEITFHPGFLQIKFDMAVEDLPIYFERTLSTGEKLILSGIFSVNSTELIIDIRWNLTNGYLNITTNIDRELEIKDFLFKIGDRIDVHWSSFLIREGSFTLSFDNHQQIFELQILGSVASLEGLSVYLYIQSRDFLFTSDLDYMQFLGGGISFTTVPGSHEWNIESIRDINLFTLTGFNFSINKTIEGGVSYLQWNRKSDISISATFNLINGEGSIEIDRYSLINGSLVINDAFIRYNTPNGKSYGGRLRSFSANYQRTGHEYFYVEWKKGEYLDIAADFAANWNLTFDRFFDILDLIGKVDVVGGSVDGNFTLHYEAPENSGSGHHLDLNILEETSLTLLEIKNYVAFIFERKLTLGSLEIQPGEIDIDWLINESKDTGWININNTGATVEFQGLSFERGLREITLLDVSISDGKFYIEFDKTENSGSTYIVNTATVELTLLEFSKGLDLVRIERDLEFGIITMLPGEFYAEWVNTTGDYNKTFNIRNGIFELTFARLKWTFGSLEIYFSLFNVDRDFSKEIEIKTRNKGSGNRGFCITTTTDDPLQFDMLSFGIAGNNWELIIDLFELQLVFTDWYLGTWDGNFTIGGSGTLDVVDWRLINITIQKKNAGGQTQELFVQLCNKYNNHPHTKAVIIDTNNMTENANIDLPEIKINDMSIDAHLTVYPQRYLIAHADFNPEPIGATVDGHIYIDSDNEELGSLSIEISKHVDLLNADVGLYAELDVFTADEFHIWGEFTQKQILPGVWIWVPTDWGKSGTLDVVNFEQIKLIYNDHETEIWPCIPQAILDKTEYGVSFNHPDITFDTSGSKGYVFGLTKMRWDWDDNNGWTDWMTYQTSYTKNFLDFLNSQEESREIKFQVKTIVQLSDITTATILKGNDFQIKIQFDGDKLFEFEEFTVNVLDYDTKLPVEGATVQYISYDDLGNPTVEDTNTTDSNGNAGFIAIEVPDEDLDHRIYCKAFVQKDGYINSYSDYFWVYDILADLIGYIKDLVTWEHVYEALITAEPGGYYCYMPPKPSQGPFHLYVPPGTYTITASMEGYTTTVLFDNFVVEQGTTAVNLGTSFLSPTSYGGINGTVYDATNGDERIWGAKVTVEIPGEDDLVSYSSVFGYFPSMYYDYHSFKLNPGTYTVIIEKDEYNTYSEEVEVVAGQVTEMEVYLDQEWASPTDYDDPNNKWNDETNAYDEDETTRAVSNKKYMGEDWTEYLYLSRSQINCDKIRFNAWYNSVYCKKIDIDVYYNSGWHDVYEGAYANKEWVEKTLSGTYSVEEARVRFYLKGYAWPWGATADLYEFDFHQSL